MDKEEKGTVRSGGGSERPCRVLLRQLDLFLFTVCLIKCPFMELPVVSRRGRDTHLHKAEVFAVLLTERRGRVRERQRDGTEMRGT